MTAYKPPKSHAENEARVLDFVGMLGLPLVLCHDFPTRAAAAFFSVHALKDPAFATTLQRFLRAPLHSGSSCGSEWSNSLYRRHLTGQRGLR